MSRTTRGSGVRIVAQLWLVGALALTSTAHAEVSLAGSIGGTSDFVFRGLSYTRGEPAAQASLEVEFPARLYVGTFVSSVNPNRGRSPAAEVDLWLGYYWQIADAWSADLRYTHYMYPDDPRVADYDRDELTATLSWRNAWFLSATYSPNTAAIASAPGATRDDTLAAELSWRHAFSPRWSISIGAGHYILNDVYPDDYSYWSATLTANLAPIELHLAALGADSAAERLFTTRNAGERIALTVLYRFATTR